MQSRQCDLVVPTDGELSVIVASDLPDDLAAVQAHFPTITPRSHDGINGNLLFTSFEIPTSRP